jgi:hypothetical protein
MHCHEYSGGPYSTSTHGGHPRIDQVTLDQSCDSRIPSAASHDETSFVTKELVLLLPQLTG